MNATLNDDLINFGANLVTLLDQQKIMPDAAFWLYLPENESWKLIISQKKVGTEGPKKIYKIIKKILDENSQSMGKFSLEDISLVKPDSFIINLLRSAIRIEPGSNGIRFTRNVINGIMIEDAYIYRML